MTLILDEAESDERQARLRAVIEMVRRMSSGKGQQTLRGSAGGEATSFSVTGTAYMSSVLPGPMRPQDKSRITLLQLGALPTGPEAQGAKQRSEAATEEAAQMAPALWARALAGWDRFQATFDAYRTELMDREATAREADQLATLLAGHDLLCEDSVPDQARIDRALELVAGILADTQTETRTGEGDECLAHLMTSGAGVMRDGREMTVAELVLRLRDSKGVCEQRPQLEAIGIKLIHRGGPGDVLLVANRHQGLARIFNGTRWANGGHVQALRYLYGAEAYPSQRFSGLKQRCTAIPSTHLPEPDDSNPDSEENDMGG